MQRAVSRAPGNQPGATPGLLQLSWMELELGVLLDGREVVLRAYEDLSHHFRDAVREQATTLYDAA